MFFAYMEGLGYVLIFEHVDISVFEFTYILFEIDILVACWHGTMIFLS